MLDARSLQAKAMLDAVAAPTPKRPAGWLPPDTDWYDSRQLPIRTGVFKCRNSAAPDATIRYRYFDGTNWYYGAESPRGALMMFQTQAIIVPAQSWCGLTERAE